MTTNKNGQVSYSARGWALYSWYAKVAFAKVVHVLLHFCNTTCPRCWFCLHLWLIWPTETTKPLLLWFCFVSQNFPLRSSEESPVVLDNIYFPGGVNSYRESDNCYSAKKYTSLLLSSFNGNLNFRLVKDVCLHGRWRRVRI